MEYENTWHYNHPNYEDEEVQYMKEIDTDIKITDWYDVNSEKLPF